MTAMNPDPETPHGDTPYTGRKVTVPLVGEDGNAFAIIGRVRRAMRRAGFSREAIDQYTASATSGNYEHLLQVTLQYVDEPGTDDDVDDDAEDN